MKKAFQQKIVKILFFFLLCTIGIASVVFHLRKEEADRKDTTLRFYQETPIKAYSKSVMPIVDVEVDDSILPLAIDLGYSGNIQVYSEFLETFRNKEELKMGTSRNFLGNTHQHRDFQIPCVHIDQLTLTNLILSETTREYEEESIIKAGKIKEAGEYKGMLGWTAFYGSNFGFDKKNHKIIFFDSIETLEDNGHPVSKFHKASFIVKNEAIQVDFLLNGKTVTGFLDSGCTFNVMNHDIDENISIKEWVLKPEGHEEIESVKIAGHELGPMHFCKIPLKFPYHYDVVLGMEFMQNYVLFIHFKNKEIYFLSHNELEELSGKKTINAR